MNGGKKCAAGHGTKGAERLSGNFVEWVEERGFGWVEHEGGRLFAHIRELRKGRLPVKEDGVTFVQGLDPLGRPCATALVPDRQYTGPGLWACVQLSVLLVLPFLAGLKLLLAVWAVPAAMMVV